MPIIAFKIKIDKITNGSTHAGTECMSVWSSKQEIINEIIADANKILTNLSSHYSLILSHKLSFSSSYNLFKPYLFYLAVTSSLVKPLSILVYKFSSVSFTVKLWNSVFIFFF